MIHYISIFVLSGCAIYLGLALVLLAWPFPPARRQPGEAPEELEHLVSSGAMMAAAEAVFFQARDGAQRLYRLYPGRGQDLLVFLHGSASDSTYLARFASALAASPGGPTVVTPDLRGHGAAPVRRGDVDHVNQQEHDIADLLAALDFDGRYRRFFLGGHSTGGGLAIRYAAGRQLPAPDGLVLLAPFIHWQSPAARKGSGGWATSCIPRFAGVEMLGRVGIHAFEKRPVLRFNVPASCRTGTETLFYSWRLYKSLTPSDDWQSDIRRIRVPVLLVAAELDSIFRTQGYEAVFSSLQQVLTLEVIHGADHFQLSVSDAVSGIISRWSHGLCDVAR